MGHADDRSPLGAGESGKSTVLKQMRLIHAGGFSRNERKQWRVVIFHNLVNAFQILLGAMEDTNTEFEDEDNMVSLPPSAESTPANHPLAAIRRLARRRPGHLPR